MSWWPASVDERAAQSLARAANLRPLTARILVGRGLGDRVDRFLNPRLQDLRSPEGISDLERALDRLEAALREGHTIGVFGDYDVDGVTSAAVLTSGLSALGASLRPRVANRLAGYGLGVPDAIRFADEGCRLVVTGDCGTSDHEAIALLASRGVDTIVIDHHQVPSGPSPALALINPHRGDDRFPFKGLASCGLAFYLMAALRSRLRALGHPAAAAFDPRSLLDLVALGTIADVVPLVDENRILVAAGLRQLGLLARPGLRALARLAEIAPDDGIDESHVSFRLGPRLNAAGRLGDAGLALDVLLAGDDGAGERLAASLDERNRERQRIQEDVVTQAQEAAERLIAESPDLPALVVGGQGWHQGVVGIVAARLVDRHQRPAIVVGFDGPEGRGSARTVPGVDLYRALAACAPHLVKFGGHAAAAGLSVREDQFAAFRDAFVQAVAGAGVTEGTRLEVDARAGLAELDLAGAEELARLSPFGCANAQPLLALPGVTAVATRVVGNGHLQLTLSQQGAVADAIGFGLAAQRPESGQPLDVLAFAEINRFRGTRRARLRVKHLLLPVGSGVTARD